MSVQENLRATNPEDELQPPYAGPRGHVLVGWALKAGPNCIVDLGSHQARYFQALARTAGVSWPEGFFISDEQTLLPPTVDHQ